MKKLIDLTKIQRILVINLAFIGDVLLSFPVVTALKSLCPEAKIDMLVMPLTAPIAAGNPNVDKVLVYDKRGQHKQFLQLFKLIREVRSQHYDLAVCTNFAVRGAMLTWAAGIPTRLGYDRQHGGLFLTHATAADRTPLRHEADNYLDVLQPLPLTAKNSQLYFTVSDHDRQSLAVKVPQLDWNRPIAAICPVGSYSRKSWTIAGNAQLIRRLAEECQVVLIGGNKEAAQLAALRQASLTVPAARSDGDNARSFSRDSVLILAGELTLGELAALLAACQVLVSVDTGPMHLAQAVGTPVVALFGPTDPAIWGPRSPQDQVFYDPIACSPCWGKGPCSVNRCLTGIAAEAVIAAALQQIRRQDDAVPESPLTIVSNASSA
jgi:lipopolysaccharide heptosyltransferase II